MRIQSLIKALLLFLLIFSSCSKAEDNIELLDSEYIMIIPQTGCPGCIDAGLDFVQKQLDKECITIVLTKISNLRNLKIKFGYENINSSNIFLDTSGLFEEKVARYPRFFNSNEILDLDNSNLRKYKELEQVLSECE